MGSARMSIRRSALVAVTLAALCSSVACGDSPRERVAAPSVDSPSAADGASVEDPAGETTTPLTPIVGGSRAEGYATLAQVWADSVVIVRGRATGHDTPDRPIGGVALDTDEGGEVDLPVIPETIVELEVTDVLAEREGSDVTPGAVLDLRQLGTIEAPFPDGIPVFAIGDEVVIFLDEYELGPEGATGEHVITGAAGGYAVEANGTLRLLDPLSAELPSGLTQEELVAAALR